ncbi:hypothetical protein JAAARDRAFT_198467 [Jaapia argillacea MUCL 33604]|uniref:HNH nuclease domain-containing protein n=1 Tax=Jaapia argillacea MUCL 33604 TaxID=933084 RepID=A0A067PBZ2_9AGAM|nr:hypothetical protein JAAARDRAFT_198467 [Jaapia argillacea MUCL 33604]
MPGTPLPSNPFDGLEKAAYDTCLNLESHLPGESRVGKQSPQLCGRLLGYMMLYAPTPEGRRNVATEIQTCVMASDTPDRLVDLAQFYMDHFIRAFKAAKSCTPTTSTHPSRPSLNLTAQEKHALLQEAPQNHRAAKKLCLVRDGYRCVITGKYDKATSDNQKRRDSTFAAPAPISFTELAHIIAESTNADIQWGGSKRDCPASAWAVLGGFGKVDVQNDQLNEEGIHRLPNVMTMSHDAHCYFDGLELWLEEIDTNRYLVRVTDPDYLVGLGINANNPQIQLTTTDVDLPLPDPHLLRLHAACAKVAHLSGAGQIVDAILRDIEELEVLAYDGGSAHVLTVALLNSRIQVAAH